MVSHTLIVFGGWKHDFALATDFVAIAKKFMADGLQPTCLVGTDLRDVMGVVNFPLVFGREDLGGRRVVYTRAETLNPFYTMASQNGLKHDVLAWIRNKANILQPHDRLLIVFVNHGQGGSGNLKLVTRGQYEFLTKSEVIAALNVLPMNTRITIMNEACYSGHWADVAPQAGSGRNILVECASQTNELSHNWYSGSGTYRCNLFAVAWMREITIHPDGQLSQHVSRIEEELDLLPPEHSTNRPVIVPGTRSWLSHRLSEFIISPAIATAIQNAAPEQNRHEDLLRARADARRSWKSLWKSVTGTKGLSSSAADGDVNGDNAIDSEVIIIKDYLNDLGALAHDMNRAALVNMSHYALRGGGEDQGLRGQVVKTILWQEYQDLRVETLISHLIENNLITFDVNPEDAANSLNDHAGTVCPIIDRFNKVPQISGLQVPESKDCIHIFYEDAFQRLVNVLACNQLLQPKKFFIDIIQERIVEFLQEY